ncbi:MAG: O-antigen ligase family protein, partial [Cyanobacteriota bacterium]|nr:O-antigen ligase family protein [Cyanobacteriota bacterium]
MTVPLYAWLRGDSPAAASLWGWCLFQLGLLLLPSSVLLASLLLLPALVLGSLRRESAYWRDRWNWPLMVAGGLMLLGCFSALRADLAWAGLANWLPFFWGFWGFQPYVAEAGARRRTALWMVAGTVPVVVTGLGQLWLGWQGPWQFLGGLVIWFMAPGGEPEGRLSGLFDYANIAAAWLALVWPLMLAALVQPGLDRRRRSVVLILAVALVTALVLTDSRNGWGSLVLAVPLVLGPVTWPWLLPLLALGLIPVLLAVWPGVPELLQDPARALVPESVWSRLSDSRYAGERVLASTRLSQWGLALQFIAERPWLGWGAAAFSVLYPLRTGTWHGHSHNLPLELAVSSGVPVALALVGLVLVLLIVSLRCSRMG